MRCIPSARFGLPLIHREAVHPAEGEHIGIGKTQIKTDLYAQATQHLGGEDAWTGNDEE